MAKRKRNKKRNRPVGRPATTNYGEDYGVSNPPTDTGFSGYKTGGFLKGLGDAFQNIGVGIADNALSAVGAGRVLDDAYSKNDMGKGFRGVTDITGQISAAALPLVGTAVAGPAGGMVAGQLQNIGSQFNTQPEGELRDTEMIGQGFGQLGSIAGQFYNPFGANAMKVGAGHNTFEQGGMPGMIPVEVEGTGRQQGTPVQMKAGELLVSGGKIKRNYVSGNPHSSGGLDVTAPEGAIVIPKTHSQRYIDSNMRERKLIEDAIVARQNRKEDIENIAVYNDAEKASEVIASGGAYLKKTYTGGGSIHVTPKHRKFMDKAAMRVGFDTDEYIHNVAAMMDGGALCSDCGHSAEMEIPSKKQKNPGYYASGGTVKGATEKIGRYDGGGWIQKATASIKRRGTEGKCTPITKPGCTGRARALALTFKKIARNRKKAEGGYITEGYQEGGPIVPGTFREGPYYSGTPQGAFGFSDEDILRNLGLSADQLTPEEVNTLRDSYGYQGTASNKTFTPDTTGATTTAIGPTGIGRVGSTGAPKSTTGGGTGPTGIGTASNPNLFGSTGTTAPSPSSTPNAPGGQGHNVGDYLGMAAEYAAPLYNIGAGLFGKINPLDAKDYQVGKVGYHDTTFNREPYLRARASGANNLRNIYANSPGAYRSSIGNLYSQFASEEQKARNAIDNQNALNRIGVDATNLGAEQYNKQTAFSVEDYNRQLRSARQNMLAQGLGQLGQIAGGRRRDAMGLDYIEGAYGPYAGPDFQGSVDRTRRRYFFGN